MPRLPAVPRVYVGCAARLYGEVETADLVKIHVQSGKLSLMTYDDFAGKPLPRLLERVKVDMRAQRVVFFDYGAEEKVQLLYRKSELMTPADEGYDEQARFDAALAATGIDVSGFGPDDETLAEELRRRGLAVRGFALVRAGANRGAGRIDA